MAAITHALRIEPTRTVTARTGAHDTGANTPSNQHYQNQSFARPNQKMSARPKLSLFPKRWSASRGVVTTSTPVSPISPASRSSSTKSRLHSPPSPLSPALPASATDDGKPYGTTFYLDTPPETPSTASKVQWQSSVLSKKRSENFRSRARLRGRKKSGIITPDEMEGGEKRPSIGGGGPNYSEPSLLPHERLPGTLERSVTNTSSGQQRPWNPDDNQTSPTDDWQIEFFENEIQAQQRAREIEAARRQRQGSFHWLHSQNNGRVPEEAVSPTTSLPPVDERPTLRQRASSRSNPFFQRLKSKSQEPQAVETKSRSGSLPLLRLSSIFKGRRKSKGNAVYEQLEEDNRAEPSMDTRRGYSVPSKESSMFANLNRSRSDR